MPVPVQFEMPKKMAYSVITLPVVTMSGLADADIVTAFTPGFVGSIVRTFFVVGTVPASTGGKASTLNFEINTVNLAGGEIALTTANCATMGVIVAGTAITGSNRFDKDDTISVEATATTTFSEGNGYICIVIAVPIFS